MAFKNQAHSILNPHFATLDAKARLQSEVQPGLSKPTKKREKSSDHNIETPVNPGIRFKSAEGEYGTHLFDPNELPKDGHVAMANYQTSYAPPHVGYEFDCEQEEFVHSKSGTELNPTSTKIDEADDRTVNVTEQDWRSSRSHAESQYKKIRSTWSGTVEFGGFSMRIIATPMAMPNPIRYRRIHNCSRPIRQPAVCPDCGDISPETTGLGYEHSPDLIVPITREDLAACRPESATIMKIIKCVPFHELRLPMLPDSLYLQPVDDRLGLYGGLRDVLFEERKCALTRVTIGRRGHLAVIRSRGELLLLYRLFFEDELRTPPEVNADSVPDLFTVELMRALVRDFAGPLEYSSHVDRYEAALLDLVEERVAVGREAARVEIQAPRRASNEEIEKRGSGQSGTIQPSMPMAHIHSAVASASGTPNRISCAFRILDEIGNMIDEKVWVVRERTSNYAQLLTVVSALKCLPVSSLVRVHSAATYVRHPGANLARQTPALSEWMRKYRAGNVKNCELWQQFEAEAECRTVHMDTVDPRQISMLRSLAERALLS